MTKRRWNSVFREAIGARQAEQHEIEFAYGALLNLLDSEWRPVPDFYEREFASVARSYFRATVFWLVLGILVGLSYSFQFVEGWGSALIPPSPEHSLGRIRMAHSNLMIFGVLLNTFLGALHAVCSRPSREATGGRGTAFLGFWILQFSLLGGGLGIVYGEAEAIPYFEMPIWADAGMAIGWLFAFGSILGALDSREDENVRGVLPWVAVAFVGGLWIHIGATSLPFFPLPQNVAARWIAAFQSGLFHLFLLPLGIGAVLYFLRLRLPHALWNRWWQGLLAILLAASAPMAGLGLYAVEPLPAGLIQPAYIATILYGGILALLAISFGLALRSAMHEKLEPPPWNARAVIWYTAGSVAIAIYAAQSFEMLLDPGLMETVRFTDWTVGRQHLLLFLGLGAWVFGMLDDLWPELRRSEGWRMPLLADLHLALTLAGGWTLVLSLFAAGWVQSSLHASLVPWSDVLDHSGVFWLTRTVAGASIFLGQIFLLMNFVSTRDRSLPELRKPKDSEAIHPELLDPEEDGLLR